MPLPKLPVSSVTQDAAGAQVPLTEAFDHLPVHSNHVIAREHRATHEELRSYVSEAIDL